MNQNRLLENRRLGLVFDLDNTLMEQTDDLENTIATSFGIPDMCIRLCSSHVDIKSSSNAAAN